MDGPRAYDFSESDGGVDEFERFLYSGTNSLRYPRRRRNQTILQGRFENQVAPTSIAQASGNLGQIGHPPTNKNNEDIDNNLNQLISVEVDSDDDLWSQMTELVNCADAESLMMDSVNVNEEQTNDKLSPSSDNKENLKSSSNSSEKKRKSSDDADTTETTNTVVCTPSQVLKGSVEIRRKNLKLELENNDSEVQLVCSYDGVISQDSEETNRENLKLELKNDDSEVQFVCSYDGVINQDSVEIKKENLLLKHENDDSEVQFVCSYDGEVARNMKNENAISSSEAEHDQTFSLAEIENLLKTKPTVVATALHEILTCRQLPTEADKNVTSLAEMENLVKTSPTSMATILFKTLPFGRLSNTEAIKQKPPPLTNMMPTLSGNDGHGLNNEVTAPVVPALSSRGLIYGIPSADFSSIIDVFVVHLCRVAQRYSTANSETNSRQSHNYELSNISSRAFQFLTYEDREQSLRLWHDLNRLPIRNLTNLDEAVANIIQMVYMILSKSPDVPNFYTNKLNIFRFLHRLFHTNMAAYMTVPILNSLKNRCRAELHIATGRHMIRHLHGSFTRNNLATLKNQINFYNSTNVWVQEFQNQRNREATVRAPLYMPPSTSWPQVATVNNQQQNAVDNANIAEKQMNFNASEAYGA